MSKRTFLAVAALCLSAPVHAYVIDGKPWDWGIHQTGNASDWTPGASVNAWAQEDQTGGANTFLNPGYGGQKYDAEAIYVDWDSSNVYVGLFTGLPPGTKNSGGDYAPGDFAFDFGNDGTYEFGLVTTTNLGQTVGGLYKQVNWGKGLWNGVTPTAVLGGTLAGLGTVKYPSKGYTNIGAFATDTHYFIEAAIPIEAFGAYWGVGGPNQKFYLQWTMQCANDVIGVDPPVQVPEPSSALLLALGMGSLTWMRRRSRRGR